jgi:hypothetical protein
MEILASDYANKIEHLSTDKSSLQKEMVSYQASQVQIQVRMQYIYISSYDKKLYIEYVECRIILYQFSL